MIVKRCQPYAKDLYHVPCHKREPVDNLLGTVRISEAS